MKTAFYLALMLMLTACNNTKCIDGHMAYKSGDAWVIPDGAYQCVHISEVEYE